MMTKTFRKSLIAAGLVAAFGGAGIGQAVAQDAMHSDSSMQSDTTMGQKVSDTWITTKVKSEFATTKNVNFSDTSVDTRDGVVMLTGMVRSDAERQAAINAARSVKGVKAVQADKLKVGAADDAMGDDDAMDSDNDMRSDTDSAADSVGEAVSDTWITTKVKSRFATTGDVDFTGTSVDTKDGVVMLTGTVDSANARQSAITAARSIKGVKAVQADKLMVGTARHDAMGNGAMDDGKAMNSDDDSADTSVGQAASDTWITTKVKSKFATTSDVDFTGTSVDTKDGVVMLTGTVDNANARQAAIAAARSIKGVKAVQADKLMVGADSDSMDNDSDMDNDQEGMSDTSMGTKVSDTWITTKVKSEFATTEGVGVTDVAVDTKAGVVMLTGTVKSDAEKDMAVKAARSVKGVKAVEAGNLKVAGE